MRIRSTGLVLFAGLSIIVGACSSAGSSSAPASQAPASQPASVAPASQAPVSQAPASQAPSSNLKIGVVTDVGTVNDKNFNEYTYKGAQAGAAAIGVAGTVPYAVPKDAAEYPSLLQAFIDQKFDIIVTAGFNLGVETTKFAHDNPNTWFIGVDQGPPCVDEQGLPDTTFACKGDAATLLPKYIAISYQEDQAGYLAGMVAASVSKTGTIGAISGITLCGPCTRYIQGYELGAQSINPAVKTKVAFVTESDFVKAFNDPVTGKSFGTQFLKTNSDVDVLFQVAGKTGNGILDAACDASIYGVGVDVDQALSYPNAAKCTVTSAEKKLSLAVSEDIKAIAAGTAKGGDDHWDAARDGIGYSPFHDLASVVPADMTTKLDAAFAQMQAGTLKTCPDKCGDVSTLK